MKIGHGRVGYRSSEEARDAAIDEDFFQPIILKRKFHNGREEFGWFDEREHVERIKQEFEGVKEI